MTAPNTSAALAGGPNRASSGEGAREGCSRGMVPREPRQRRLTPAERRDIYRRFRDMDQTPPIIAEAFGVTANTVRKVLRSYGCDMMGRLRSRQVEAKDEWAERIYRMRLEGVPWRRMMVELDLGQGTIRYARVRLREYCARHGLVVPNEELKKRQKTRKA